MFVRTQSGKVLVNLNRIEAVELVENKDSIVAWPNIFSQKSGSQGIVLYKDADDPETVRRKWNELSLAIDMKRSLINLE